MADQQNLRSFKNLVSFGSSNMSRVRLNLHI
jgi:hypothetical protein